MSTLTNIFGEHIPLDIECEEDFPVIWIRDGYAVVSLTLTDRQMTDLEAAIRVAKAKRQEMVS